MINHYNLLVSCNTRCFNYVGTGGKRRRMRSGGPQSCPDRSVAEKFEPSSPGLDSKNAKSISFTDMLFHSHKRETVQDVRGTSAMHGPERSGDIRTRSPGLGSETKKGYPLRIPYLSYRARDGIRTRPLKPTNLDRKEVRRLYLFI